MDFLLEVIEKSRCCIAIALTDRLSYLFEKCCLAKRSVEYTAQYVLSIWCQMKFYAVRSFQSAR